MNTLRQGSLKLKGKGFETHLKMFAAAFLAAALPCATQASQALPRTDVGKPVLADLEMLERVGARVLARHATTNVGFAKITPRQEQELSVLAHERGRCGGFEALPEGIEAQSLDLAHVFAGLSEREAKDRSFRALIHPFSAVAANPEIEAALGEVSENELRASVDLLSGFQTRYHKSNQPNQAVQALKSRVEEKLKGATVPYQIEFITHSATQQNSLRVRIPGAKRPSEILVIGAHLDSINHEWFGNRDAPGADDNASGSSNLIETLRVLSRKAQPERTIEFIWYAGEEGGLLGSSEIAREYKSRNADVIAVLQLDMTLHPGDGEFTLGSMTDFTSAWFRSYLAEINSQYINAKIIEDKCGYGCSDHASWYRQGYPTLMPFEATYRGMNRDIHSSRDTIKTTSSFRHSAMFSRLALAIAMDLGNSTLRETR